MNDEQMIVAAAAEIVRIKTQRFPDGLNSIMDEIISDVLFDAFLAGARFNDEHKSRIIIPGTGTRGLGNEIPN